MAKTMEVEMLSIYEVDDARAEESQAKRYVEQAEQALQDFAKSGKADPARLAQLEAELGAARARLQGARGCRIGYDVAISVG